MSKSAIKDTIYWDKRLSWASTAFFIGSVGNASLKTVLPIPDSLWGVMSAVVGIGIICIFAMNFKEMLKRKSTIFWRTIFLFIILYALSAVLILMRGEPLRQMLMGTAFLTFVWWIPSGIYACSVCDKRILYQVWVKASYLISAFAIVMFFFHIPQENSIGGAEYNMSFGFYIILPLLIQMNEYTQRKRIWLLVLILFEIFTIFVYANRGVLLSLIFFVIYKFAFESDSRIRKLVSIIFLILLTIAMLSSIQTIASYLVAVLDTFGFESRTLGMLAGGSISDSSGRDELWDICFRMIEQRPFLGWGLGGEYYEIGKLYMGASGDEILASSFNPHNGIIQNLVCFGLLLGLFLNIFVLYPLFHLKFHSDKFVHMLLLIFASSSVIPICISASGFFITPGVAVYLYLFYVKQPLGPSFIK